MGKKSRNNRRGPIQPAQATAKPVQKAVVTASDALASQTEADFEKTKEALLGQLMDEIGALEATQKDVQDAIEAGRLECEELETRRAKLIQEKQTLQADYDTIREDYERASAVIERAEQNAQELLSSAETQAETVESKAKETANALRLQAEAESKRIQEDMEKERLQKLAEASEEVRKAWNAGAEDLKAQIDSISARERTLHATQLELERDKQDLDLEREALDEQQTYIQCLKERYSAANPAKLEMLKLEQKEAQKRYDILLERYDTLSRRLEENQVLLDTIKTEVEDPTSGRRITSLNEIVTALGELREKYGKLKAAYSRYPDDESVAHLEEKALKAEKLERVNDALEQERDRYREEAAAARNARRELEVIRQEVEATNALNEHLIRELESHKTALESRTGDTCPALSKVDIEAEENGFLADIKKRKGQPALTSLKELVTHVKNYAGSQPKEKRLFYTENDIRAFLAGMAVSKLIILQGMSGTGKSSLPRIFSEAVSGFNRLIPVESSWRDRNELLGYYNDFNKKFNAKSFTIELYRSSKEQCREIPTFIVLDEMNLARIEYYFSDFLAILQEPDHSKWLIELVSSDMRTLPVELPEQVKRTMEAEAPSIFAIWNKIERSRLGDRKSEVSDEEKGQLTAYLTCMERLTGAKDLIDGRKIRISDNIWFIGTANQDESTFEISDKVYDRAQIVSLNKKGISEKYSSAAKKYISVTKLQELFEKAVSDFKEQQRVEDRLNQLDQLLIDKFDISFGNRIVTQTVNFAAVFVAAGGNLEDALDYQIATKILRKVTCSDDADAFQELLEATGEYPETRRLINRRLKDLR